MRPPARHAATCWVAAVRRNDQLEDISFCFMGSVHTVVYVRFPFPVLVLSFPKKRPPCRLNHPTEHPAFLFYRRSLALLPALGPKSAAVPKNEASRTMREKADMRFAGKMKKIAGPQWRSGTPGFGIFI